MSAGAYEIHLYDEGKKRIENYIKELKAKRKEILDAGLDTANDTNLPTVEDIIADIDSDSINWDEDGAFYYNGWAVTDNHDADYPLLLKVGHDIDLRVLGN